MLIICMVPANERKKDTDNILLDEYISQIADSKKDAFELLYNHTHVSVYSFAFSILKNSHDAEDVLHDCYLRIYATAQNYKSQGKPMAWIMTITKNLCLMKIREHQKISDVPLEDWESYLSSNDNLSMEDKTVLRECMRVLSDEERQIVTLHSVAGFKHREIAHLCNMPLATVLSKYNRAIKKLRKSLQGGV